MRFAKDLLPKILIAPTLLVSALVGCETSTPLATRGAQEVDITTLSNRPDLVSGGDVLLEVSTSGNASIEGASIRLGERDLSAEFHYVSGPSGGRLVGLVTGLKNGNNEVVAQLADGRGASLDIVNHPHGGPVFSGPQVQPWNCQPSAEDEQCNQAPTYEFFYLPAVTHGLGNVGRLLGQILGGVLTTLGNLHLDAILGLRPYDPERPPSSASIARVQTDEGVEVPFIVRVETGYQNRDQYKIATIYDPAKPWEPWAPQEHWAHKLLITHGASCGLTYEAGTAPSVTSDVAIIAMAKGYAVMSTALNNAGHNCNVVTQAESLVMAKERVIETLGEVRFTVGSGCSGGSLTQQQVANAYPGIYQGILPQCSFPDAWSTANQLFDYHIVRDHVENPASWDIGVAWGPLSVAAVEGHPNHLNAIILDTLYWTAAGDPSSTCPGLSSEQTYHAENNPTGVRCALADYMVNVFGRRPEDGFAGRPVDNVGVQYGLHALEQGFITPAQFVDLNVNIGSVDIDSRPTAERVRADQPALARAYRSGAINTATHLDKVAIINLAGPDPGLFHDAYRAWAIRARIEREHGHFRNHVIWFGLVPVLGDPTYAIEGLLAMDRWLAAVEADSREVPLAQKIVDNRPDDIQDRCSQIPLLEVASLPGIGQVCQLPLLQTRFGTPRMVAGSGVETDINKCQLKRHRREDYYPVHFTDEQWRRLDATFPDGVCDWTLPGVDQQPTIPWMTYDVVGGRPLGDAATSQPLL
ncbi:MAG: hypothetical protein EVA65_01390 [Oceanococcus sp.]|nr:MAG: hypothetical protein EVA65_01390 [Oceanococcus sp.]